ncbi:MAG: hypothetical protein O2955_08200 [Planctomycetota bacterium]|nr:hypothetical protein [Planctomycetota bacterium]MDA1212484.1 hypothetical protein [Planctomycetota bacterium]
MDVILRGYDVNPATWFYLSFLLIIAVYFRFSRVWSIRNFDLFLLLMLSPGLLIVPEEPDVGYGWLFGVTGLILIRLFCDGWFQRRPRLEPNLNIQGMGFLCASAFAFLMTQAFTESPPASTMETVRKADRLLHLQDGSLETSAALDDNSLSAGPATQLLTVPLVPTSKVVSAHQHNGTVETNESRLDYELLTARLMAVLTHSAVILGLIVLAHVHFGDAPMGVAMATLYLLIPCTAYDVGKVIHVLPAALIVWALVAVRRPMWSGALLGLACGILFFPIFLLPLWIVYYGRNYGRKGMTHFVGALGLVAAILVGSLALTSVDSYSFIRQTLGSIDWSALQFQGIEAEGFWTRYGDAYRMPVFVTFVLLLLGLTIWPWQKNLEDLMAHSTAIVVATQFWYPQQGGVYLLWYIPLLLVVVFRPRLVPQRGTEPIEGKQTPISVRIPWDSPHLNEKKLPGNKQPVVLHRQS